LRLINEDAARLKERRGESMAREEALVVHVKSGMDASVAWGSLQEYWQHEVEILEAQIIELKLGFKQSNDAREAGHVDKVKAIMQEREAQAANTAAVEACMHSKVLSSEAQAAARLQALSAVRTSGRFERLKSELNETCGIAANMLAITSTEKELEASVSLVAAKVARYVESRKSTLRQVFIELDRDRSGRIEVRELEKLCLSEEGDVAHLEVARCMRCLDSDADASVDLSELIAGLEDAIRRRRAAAVAGWRGAGNL